MSKTFTITILDETTGWFKYHAQGVSQSEGNAICEELRKTIKPGQIRMMTCKRQASYMKAQEHEIAIADLPNRFKVTVPSEGVEDMYKTMKDARAEAKKLGVTFQGRRIVIECIATGYIEEHTKSFG